MRTLLRPHKYIYFAGLLLALHSAFTIYINSSFLSQFLPEESVGFLYSLGAAAALLSLVVSPWLLRRFKNFTVMSVAIVFEAAALLTLATSTNLTTIEIAFVVHAALPTLLFFNLDVFLENATKSEGQTGRIRSTYLTIVNFAILVSPISVGWIIEHVALTPEYTSDFGPYRIIFAISMLMSVALFLFIAGTLKRLKLHNEREINFIDSLRKFVPHLKLDQAFLMSFLLQAFYAIMTIFTPLYLHSVVGFDWQTIGLIFTVMLVPFVLFEGPIGRAFDRVRIERDTLMIGFFLMCGTTLLMFFIKSPSILVWMLVLFISRVGASFVEVSNDFVFFRQVNDRDAGFISIYRMAAPAAYIITALFAGILLTTVPLQVIFLPTGVLMAVGIGVAYTLRKPSA